jgi:hypothetical protein
VSAARPENYGAWFYRVLTWDSLLLACVAILPVAVERILPNHRGAIEVTAIALPITAFFLRIRAGRRFIASNGCDGGVRRFQFVVFCLGIVPLILTDCVFILTRVMPRGAVFNEADWLFWVVSFGIYFTSMLIAMYPGRAKAPTA